MSTSGYLWCTSRLPFSLNIFAQNLHTCLISAWTDCRWWVYWEQSDKRGSRVAVHLDLLFYNDRFKGLYRGAVLKLFHYFSLFDMVRFLTYTGERLVSHLWFGMSLCVQRVVMTQMIEEIFTFKVVIKKLCQLFLFSWLSPCICIITATKLMANIL